LAGQSRPINADGRPLLAGCLSFVLRWQLSGVHPTLVRIS
jgi:hypothetical protein